jgi:hypothetical protein
MAHNLTSLVKLWFHTNTTVRQQWPVIRKQCGPGCTKYGNCNHETGQCDCPYGRFGNDCQDMFAPACR